MKIKLKSTVQQAKTFDYLLHTLEITEANILDYLKIQSLFQAEDWNTCKWDELMKKINIYNFPSIRNIKENSFDLEIDDYENSLLKYLQDFLIENELQYEN